MTDHRPDKVLSMSCTRDSTGIIICIGTGTDDRRVSNATGTLSGDTTGRGSSGQIAIVIQGYGTHCSIFAFIEKLEILMTKIR